MKKIRVLPIYPEFPLTFWSFRKTLEYLRKSAVMPPTGLATVLAMLPADRFECRRIIDLNVEPLKDEYFKDADLVFTSTMLIQQASHDEVIERARRHGVPVVAGGPFPTSYPELNQQADYIVGGEAEITLPAFIEDLLHGRPQKIYTEQSVIASGQLRAGLTYSGKAEMTHTPLPRWDLLRLDRYASASVQYSRGCPFDCEFCDITKLFGRESRTKTPEQMTREFDALYARKFHGSVFIVDDNFIGNRKHVREFLPAAEQWQKERGFPFQFFTEASMNLAWPQNEDILQGMVAAGFDEVFLGIESVDEEVLATMNKGQNIKSSPLEAIRTIQRAGLSVTGGFIIGSDGEKPAVFDNLYNFIQQAGVVIPMPGLLTALKGTNLWQRLEREGRLRGQSSGNNTHSFGFNFEPQLDEQFLLDGYRQLLGRLFDEQNYYRRCRQLHKNLGRVKRGRPIRREELLIFLRSLKGLLFRRGGWEYAKYLVHVGRHYPAHISEAVANGIKFDHLRSITKVTLEMDQFRTHLDSLYDGFRDYINALSKEYRALSSEYRARSSEYLARSNEYIHSLSSEYDGFKHKLEEEFRLAAEKLRAEAERTLQNAQARCERIHADIKHEAQKAVEFLREKLQTDIENLLRGRGVGATPA